MQGACIKLTAEEYIVCLWTVVLCTVYGVAC